MKKIEISSFGNLLIYDGHYSADFIEKTIRTKGLCGLRIFDSWDPLPSLDFLRDFSFLKHLSVTCRYDQDYSFLRDMPQLENLAVGPSFPMKNPIDLSFQVNLRSLGIQWRKGRISGLEECKNLEDVCLVEFKDADLRLIAGLIKIVRLRVKTGSMKSLDGIERLDNLVELEIGNCRSLTQIAQLNGLHSLRSIKIESCRKVSDWETISELPSLENLTIINCGPVPPVDFKSRLPKLKELWLLGNSAVRKK